MELFQKIVEVGTPALCKSNTKDSLHRFARFVCLIQKKLTIRSGSGDSTRWTSADSIHWVTKWKIIVPLPTPSIALHYEALLKQQHALWMLKPSLQLRLLEFFRIFDTWRVSVLFWVSAGRVTSTWTPTCPQVLSGSSLCSMRSTSAIWSATFFFDPINDFIPSMSLSFDVMVSSTLSFVFSAKISPFFSYSLTGDGKPVRSGSVFRCIRVNGSFNDTTPPISDIKSFT